ncbi:MAG: glycosyltransferase, partial [Hyphomicrobiales bacterium]
MQENELNIFEPVCSAESQFPWLSSWQAGYVQAIYNVLCKVRPEVIHINLDGLIVMGGLAAILAQVPRIILHCHNMSPPELYTDYDTECFGWDRIYRALLSRPNVTMLNVSHAGLQDYLNWLDIPASEQTLVVHNGIDMQEIDEGLRLNYAQTFRQELNIPESAPVIGSAFRFEEVKQPLVWLDAARLIHNALPSAHFIMFGGGELLAESKAYAEKLGLDGVVHFPGRVSKLPQKISVLDIFMLASRCEGLPNVLIEAQCAGVVPVAFDVGGVAETMQPGETGILVQDQSARSLADAVLDIISNKKKLETMRNKGMAFIREEFSLEKMEKNLFHFLRYDRE